MKCSDVYRHICDNLDQRLGTRRCREIRRHLGACPDCRAYLESLKATVVLYRSLPAPPLPKGAHDRLIRALRESGCLPTQAADTRRAHSRRAQK
jgi:anti-sigma factor RsiW